MFWHSAHFLTLCANLCLLTLFAVDHCPFVELSWPVIRLRTVRAKGKAIGPSASESSF